MLMHGCITSLIYIKNKASTFFLKKIRRVLLLLSNKTCNIVVNETYLLESFNQEVIRTCVYIMKVSFFGK